METVVLRGDDNFSVNGTYRQYDRKTYGGAPAFIREDTRQKDTQFSIVRRGGKWFIGSGPSGKFPTDMYYKSKKTNSKVPPLDSLSWEDSAGGYMKPPQFLANEAPSDIIIEGGAVQESNGRYRLETFGVHSEGYPEYKREGQTPQGGVFECTIHYCKNGLLGSGCTKKCWVLTAFSGLQDVRYLYIAAGDPPDSKGVDQPPKNSWELLQDGVAPTPILKW